MHGQSSLVVSTPLAVDMTFVLWCRGDGGDQDSSVLIPLDG